MEQWVCHWNEGRLLILSYLERCLTGVNLLSVNGNIVRLPNKDRGTQLEPWNSRRTSCIPLHRPYQFLSEWRPSMSCFPEEKYPIHKFAIKTPWRFVLTSYRTSLNICRSRLHAGPPAWRGGLTSSSYSRSISCGRRPPLTPLSNWLQCMPLGVLSIILSYSAWSLPVHGTSNSSMRLSAISCLSNLPLWFLTDSLPDQIVR